MKILIIAGYTPSLVNFRGDLIKEMVKRGHEVVALGPETGYEEDINKLGAKFLQLPLERASTNLLKDILLVKRMTSIIKDEKPDVVFAYTIKPVIYGSIAARLSGVKSIFSMITGLGYVFLASGAKAFLIRRLCKALYFLGLRNCVKVFFQNPDDMREFMNLGITNHHKSILIHGSGVNLNQFEPVPLPDKPVFLMIARILKDKGVIEYLTAAQKVKKIYPEARFQLLGPFDINPNSLSYEDIKPYIEDGSVEYLGETKDVRPFISGCAVYVLPSYREGTPRTVLEAMAMGRSVITTDVPGCRETVVNGLNGFLVPAREVNPLAEKMTWMINNRADVLRMARESNRICREKYDVRKINETILSAMNL
ncbi:glycosyltransferase family 4 protein [Ammoniphilus sp. YIM 78166]|uniref:glycosyltransferase family 4 protein n=1 Tax=Ammoniphilus sp. YIM 78166 TaxID=1644106 RepID=UPI00106F8A22|nr:glycosyltransferase family 4 protein [Ammoniphilus sp. YIM 78166]